MLFVIFLNISAGVSLILLFITILLDWFDGLTAKKFNRGSEEGYFADLVSDRLSEGIIFSVMFFPFFFLFTANCFLTIWSVVRKRHVILPLRHILLALYVIMPFLVI